MTTELSLREVASTLYISIDTVTSQTRAVYRKLGVSDRSGAVERVDSLASRSRL